MAIVSMQKMSLVAHNSEKSKLFKIFMSKGCVELVESTALCHKEVDVKNKSVLESKHLRISFALTFLKEIAKEYQKIDDKNAVKINLKKENRLIPLDEYEETAKEETELFSIIAEMEKINAELVDIKSAKARNNALIEQLSVYAPLEIPFSEIKDSLYTFMLAGTVPLNKVESLKQQAEDFVLYAYPGDKMACVLIVGHKDKKGEILNILAASEFVRSSFNFDCTAAEKIRSLKEETEKLDKKRQENIIDAIEYSKYLASFKIIYDYYGLEKAKIEITEGCAKTQKAIVMEGWVPTDRVEDVKNEIAAKCKRAEVFFRDPLEEETPPTLTKNNKVVTAFDGITNMFGRPNYRGQDPNLFVAMFYFLFFGIMLGDAGYGVIMAIACFAFVAITKPVKDSGKMMIMFGFCGISTVIWGALFGGWFAVDLPANSIFAKLAWFNPLNEPLKMFMLSLGMGALQIGTGFALKGVAEIKSGNAVKGILNNFSWVIIFMGLFLISPSLMVFLGAIVVDVVPKWFTVCAEIGKYVAIVGAALLLTGGAIGKKNPVKMVTGALGNAYGAINVVSDLLSYSRLFGLGLTSGVIGYVINMLATIIVNTFFKGLWVGWIVAVPVLIFGHAFNLAINLLGAYVHNSRLQYIEFFGRFYEGNGRAFMPLGSKTKYTYLDN